jgi:hypothetical protein
VDHILLRLLKDRMVDDTGNLRDLEEEIEKLLPKEGQAIPAFIVESDRVMDVHVRVTIDSAKMMSPRCVTSSRPEDIA